MYYLQIGEKVMRKLLAIVSALVMAFVLCQQPLVTEASSEVKQLEKNLKTSITNKSWKNAAIYSKKLAVYYDDRKQYEPAAKYYDLTAEYWAKAGHADWGIQNVIRAEQIRTEVELYVEKPISLNKPLAKFEPSSGTYLGLFLAGKKENANPDPVKDIYGKNHAIYLTYTTYGKKYPETNSYFPIKFAQAAKRNGSGIQIGFEPMKGLDQVVDDQYIRQFAREAKASGVPVFLRFAGEMNGEWVPWSGNPKKYIEKFRLIHDIMEKEAPNVAMVWSPNFLPRHNIDQYYPGDKYVDWVGLSLYTIPYSHGKEVPGGNPMDYLKPIYAKYSHKPMMVSEGAVSHYSYEQKKDYSKWAAGQIGNMYAFLPKMYPQIKAITYFNLDKKSTTYDNSNNNYDLGDSKIVEDAYKRIIKHPYFIDRLTVDEPNSKVQNEFVKYSSLKEASGTHNVFAYVKLPLGVQPYYVAIYQGNKKLAESYAQPWEMKVDFSKVKANEPIKIIAYDKSFKRLATKEVKSSYKYVSKLSRFTDVNAKHWAFNDIDKALTNGMISGYPDGSFKPNQKGTVAEFVSILGRAYGKNNEFSSQPYPNGITNYMGKMNYPYKNSPSKVITRKEVAEIISGSQGFHYTGNDAIKYLLVNELSKGRDANNISVDNYEGNASLTRAEAVKFVMNVKNEGVQDLVERPIDPSDATSINDQYDEKFN